MKVDSAISSPSINPIHSEIRLHELLLLWLALAIWKAYK